MQFMNSTTARPGKRARAWLLAMGVVLGLGVSAVGQNVQHLSEAFAGGMPGLPVITSVEPTTNGYSITWDGPPGYYRLWERSTAPGSKLLALGKATNLVRHATVVTRATNIEFSVTGPSPVYAGSSVCVACHKTVHDPEIDTPHARAFESLKRIGQQTNGSCLPCHTVGYGLPTGFKSEAATPQLGGVQCENCHRPAGTRPTTWTRQSGRESSWPPRCAAAVITPPMAARCGRFSRNGVPAPIPAWSRT